MTATLISGRDIAKTIIETDLKPRVERLKAQRIEPKLVVVFVGDNEASASYIRQKEKFAAQAGILSEVRTFPGSMSEAELLNEIETINTDATIHGVIVQLPLPKQISVDKVLEAIDPAKDVDGFSAFNIGKLFQKKPSLQCCTPKGIITMLKNAGVQIQGQHAVVVGRSNIVGKPVSALLLNENATVTTCHRHTQNLAEVTRQADILVVAVGKPEFITGDMIKPGAVVIDVGIHRREDGRLVGDVEFDSAKAVASHISPVPGGVGPMTVVSLIENTIEAAERSV